MQINQANLSALFRGYRVQFAEAYQGAKPFWDQIAMRTPSSSAEELYHWLGAVPGMRQLVGEIQLQNLSANKYAIANDEFESTVPVKQADIERDTYGIYNPLMASLGVAAKQHPDLLVANLLINGFTTLDYTGKNFFDTDKVQDGDAKGVKFSNKGTAALSPDSFAAARAQIKSVKNSKGRPMGVGVKLQLIVPPVPAVVTRAAVVLAGETLYLRRGKTDNPFTEGAKAVRDQLNKIGFGEQPLAPIVQRAQPTAILAPAGATSSYNRVIA